MTKSRGVGLLLLLIWFPFAAAQSSPNAFETFKGLRGRWQIQSGGRTLPIEMSYDLASNGSIVTEQFGKELSVIYPDGDSLLMTHFCNSGNQPRLRLKQGGRSGVFEFEMFDITNLKDATLAHVEKIAYRVVDNQKMEVEILWKKGESQESEKYTLTRIPSGPA